MPDLDIATLTARALEAVAHLCTRCARPRATTKDWDTYNEGDGTQLCWEPDDSCRYATDIDRDTALVTATLTLVRAQLAEHIRTAAHDLDAPQLPTDRA